MGLVGREQRVGSEPERPITSRLRSSGAKVSVTREIAPKAGEGRDDDVIPIPDTSSIAGVEEENVAVDVHLRPEDSDRVELSAPEERGRGGDGYGPAILELTGR